MQMHPSSLVVWGGLGREHYKVLGQWPPFAISWLYLRLMFCLCVYFSEADQTVDIQRARREQQKRSSLLR